MNCDCCGANGEIIKISYDIYPLIPPKNIPFPISLFKKPLPNYGIKKTANICSECFEDEHLISKLEQLNPDMIVCHVEFIKEDENFKDDIKVQIEPNVSDLETPSKIEEGLNPLTSSEFLDKFF